MTTVHAITTTQRILDAPHQDLRRDWACGMSLISTSTGSAGRPAGDPLGCNAVGDSVSLALIGLSSMFSRALPRGTEDRVSGRA